MPETILNLDSGLYELSVVYADGEIWVTSMCHPPECNPPRECDPPCSHFDNSLSAIQARYLAQALLAAADRSDEDWRITVEDFAQSAKIPVSEARTRRREGLRETHMALGDGVHGVKPFPYGASRWTEMHTHPDDKIWTDEPG
ncbi:MAG TPA: hypothetical protein VNB24_09730 [Acidimicrobiales bacterium]|nr:hypothetical protein [Acidimicrobiales bacterium]